MVKAFKFNILSFYTIYKHFNIFLYNVKALGAEQMAQNVKCFSCKHETLSSEPLHPCKIPGTAVCVCLPITESQTQEVPETFWSTSVPNSMISRFTKRPCFKAQGKGWLWKTVSANLWQAHRHVHVSTPMNTHEHTYTEKKMENVATSRYCSNMDRYPDKNSILVEEQSLDPSLSHTSAFFLTVLGDRDGHLCIFIHSVWPVNPAESCALGTKIQPHCFILAIG